MVDECSVIDSIAANVAAAISTPEISVEQIQDLVEKELMFRNPYVAKKYIIYREWRTTERDKKTGMKRIMDGIVSIEKNDVNLSNANMSSHTPAGQMMTFASEVTKDYANKYPARREILPCAPHGGYTHTRPRLLPDQNHHMPPVRP